jgi:YHS domain-containing protein
MARQTGWEKWIRCPDARMIPAVLLLLTVMLAPPARAALSRLVWTDPLTGYAIGGFDPVSYFTSRRPRAGKTDFEFVWNGAAWLFANEGNMRAFARDPEVYAPQFGGYGVFVMAGGKLVRGNPMIWVKTGQRLYLFVSRLNRAHWLGRKKALLAKAAINWKRMIEDLPHQ